MATAKGVRESPPIAKARRKEVFEFIQATYDMLQGGDRTVVDWTDDGDAFMVKDEARMAVELPKFFRHSNYRSFVRQLNFYGFRKLRIDEIKHMCDSKFSVFVNPNFKRGRKDLLTTIKQKKRESEDQTVAELRREVFGLKSQVAVLQGQMALFTDFMATFAPNPSSSPSPSPSLASSEAADPAPEVVAERVPDRRRKRACPDPSDEERFAAEEALIQLRIPSIRLQSFIRRASTKTAAKFATTSNDTDNPLERMTSLDVVKSFLPKGGTSQQSPPDQDDDTDGYEEVDPAAPALERADTEPYNAPDTL